ncbi:alpha/beta hydrolase [Streptomyces gamaensis]|uniref:Alpha/beta hydrolase n=1 Tax=Streptomyces gamaensis TaxID=1763542 RepID=A0ABW0YVW3_9ACTN
MFGLGHVPADATVAYGPHPDQVVDFYLPRRPSGLRVTLLHGGFWRAAYDRRHLAPLAAALAARGAETALVEYRRGPGAWEAAAEDVLRATRCAAPYGPGGARRHVLVGHSAGGQLALWVGTVCAGGPVPPYGPLRADAAGSAGPHAGPGDTGACAPPPVSRVVAVAPVADLLRARDLRTGGGAVEDFFGPGTGERTGERPGEAPRPADRLREADPVRLPPPPVPVVLLHGTADPDVPPELSLRYVSAQRAAGGDVTLHTLDGVGHYAPVTPGTPACERLLTGL